MRYELTGKVFGDLTVIKEAPTVNKRRRWLCKCKCGNELNTLQSSLIRGATPSCGCRKKELGNRNPNWNGHEEITGSQWANIKQNAERRKHKFDITIEYAWKLFLKQGRRCSISCLPIAFSKSYNRKLKFSTREETTASLDRIDSQKGYIKGNVQWVHKDINLMKGTMPQPKFISLCRLITQYNDL